jgi:SAM-dependent methyltransferase
MSELRPEACPITGERDARLVFTYDAPPPGEVGFPRPAGEPYHRELWQFLPSGHFVSRHGMTVDTDYRGSYVDATYDSGAGLAAAFDRITALPPGRSDNHGRIERIREFAGSRPNAVDRRRLLDVGAGTGVFPWAARSIGWDCTALDPDPRAAKHLRERVGVHAVCGEFLETEGLGTFDVITFNKVLEHVQDPVRFLEHSHHFLAPGGFVYIELPDGEEALLRGPEREEFFIEHLHVFSFASIVRLAHRAGFTPVLVERLEEPSTKLTLRAFVVATAGRRAP